MDNTRTAVTALADIDDAEIIGGVAVRFASTVSRALEGTAFATFAYIVYVVFVGKAVSAFNGKLRYCALPQRPRPLL